MLQMTRGRRQIIIGEVVSDKMNKTVSVRVERKIPHPVYKKYVKNSLNFLLIVISFLQKKVILLRLLQWDRKVKTKDGVL